MITRMYLGAGMEHLIYSSDMSVQSTIIEPKLKLELGKAGTLEFTVLPNDPHYDMFERMKTVITVEMDDTVGNVKYVFRGRVLNASSDFFKQKKVNCEGDLAYLLDSIMEPYKGRKTIKAMFERIVENHNNQVDPNGQGDSHKRFVVGEVSVPNWSSDVDFDLTSYEDSSSVIESELIDSFGGLLQTRKVPNDPNVYLDYLIDPFQDLRDHANKYPNAEQIVYFGVNLLDIQSEPPVDDVFTVLLPIGKDKNVNIASVNNNSKFLENRDAITKYGRIIRCEQWSEITNKSTLLSTAQEFLNIHSAIYPDDLTIKAIDLSYFDPVGHPMLNLGDRIQCYSEPHGLVNGIYLVCTEIEYDFVNPENNTYKIGSYIPSDDHKDGNKLVKKKKGGKKKSKKLSSLMTTTIKDGEKTKVDSASGTGTNTTMIDDINARYIQVGDSTSQSVPINTNYIDITGLVRDLINQSNGST